ncbi:MAG: Hsp20/alpha crystallin family protein [Lentisphaeria bacterium]|nr:Hsp20/alpha crystallin family protein [Lentisphaeria bacterium]
MTDEIKKSDAKCECIHVRPVADVVEEHDGMEISFEIPGAAAEQVEVEIKDRLMTLNAKSSLHRRGMPIVYKRAFYLSDAVNTNGIKAKVKDGILTVFLPKSDSAKTHRITID